MIIIIIIIIIKIIMALYLYLYLSDREVSSLAASSRLWEAGCQEDLQIRWVLGPLFHSELPVHRR